ARQTGITGFRLCVPVSARRDSAAVVPVGVVRAPEAGLCPLLSTATATRSAAEHLLPTVGFEDRFPCSTGSAPVPAAPVPRPSPPTRRSVPENACSWRSSRVSRPSVRRARNGYGPY